MLLKTPRALPSWKDQNDSPHYKVGLNFPKQDRSFQTVMVNGWRDSAVPVSLLKSNKTRKYYFSRKINK